MSRAWVESVTAPALRTRDLTVGYRARRARRAVLEHINVSVHPGELVCLLGPNGIGKSTLLRTLAKMQPPLCGRVELAGSDLQSITQSDVARHLAVVLTERVVVEGVPGIRIVEWGRYPHSGWFGALTEHDRAVVEWALGAAGARHLAHRDFSRLSDGERQRIMIARALAQEPSVLVLDEPTAFLDAPSRVEVMGVLRQLTRAGALAVVVSTHDLELALRTADVVWLVMPGGEVMTGAPEDVVLAGGIAQAFEGRQIRFHPAERTFRWLSSDHGRAVVHGSGVRAAMAAAVLEREGYVVAAGAADDRVLSVDTHAAGWCASADGVECGGADFASLAAFLRRRSRAA